MAAPSDPGVPATSSQSVDNRAWSRLAKNTLGDFDPKRKYTRHFDESLWVARIQGLRRFCHRAGLLTMRTIHLLQNRAFLFTPDSA